MLRHIISLVIVLSASNAALAQVSTTRPQDWRQDLQALVSLIQNNHPNPYFQIPRASFDAAVAELNASIPGMTDNEIVTAFARIAATLRDGHTSINVRQPASQFRTFPLRLRWFSDGLFVVQAAPDYRRALGARVVTIGGTGLEQALQTIAPTISRENDYWLRVMSEDYLVTPELLQALRIIPSAERSTFVFEDQGGSFSLDLAPVLLTTPIDWLVAPDPNQIPAPLYLKDSEFFYWLQYLSESRTLYIKYNRCRDSMTLSFAEFLAHAEQVVGSKPLERVVIDVRFNPGGESSVIDPLVQGLRFRGIRPHVIIGPATFSSGVRAAMDLKDIAGTLYGEPTGGKPNSHGNVQNFSLPDRG